MTDESLALEQPYEIVSVRRAKAPPGTEGTNWHRYVIAFEGRNSIRGYRQGNLKAAYDGGLNRWTQQYAIWGANSPLRGEKGGQKITLGWKCTTT